MADASASHSTIHQSLSRPLLLAGAERAPAIANWITAAAIFFGGGLHWYTVATSGLLGNGGTLGAGAGGKVRSATEPGLHPPYPLPGLLSTARLDLCVTSPSSSISPHSHGKCCARRSSCC